MGLSQCKNVADYCDCQKPPTKQERKVELVEEPYRAPKSSSRTGKSKSQKKEVADFPDPDAVRKKQPNDKSSSSRTTAASAKVKARPKAKMMPNKPAPKVAPKKAPVPSKAPPPIARTMEATKVTEAMLLADLYKTEDVILKQIFQKFDDTQTGKLSLDQISVLHNFLAENTCLKDEGEIQEKIYNAMDQMSLCIDCNAFINLMKSNVVNDQEALRVFLDMGPESGNGGIDVVDSFTTRNTLRIVGEENLLGDHTVTSSQWDSFLDCAMDNVDFTVDMETFNNIYTKLATLLRAHRLMKTL